MPTDTVKHTPLLPCAHCGEVEHLYPAYRLDKDGKCIEPPYAIDCLGCGHDFTPRDGADARAAWSRRAPDPVREKLVDALRKAEIFISGFEGDETQESITELLSGIRATIAKAEGRS